MRRNEENRIKENVKMGLNSTIHNPSAANDFMGRATFLKTVLLLTQQQGCKNAI